MSTARLAARIREPVPHGAALLRDFQLRFNKPGADGTGKANVVRAPGEVVWGVVFEMATVDLEVLDEFEPRYIRRELTVEQDRWQRIACVYLFEEPGEELPPTPEYLAHLTTGAREHALPEEYARALARTRTTT